MICSSDLIARPLIAGLDWEKRAFICCTLNCDQHEALSTVIFLIFSHVDVQLVVPVSNLIMVVARCLFSLGCLVFATMVSIIIVAVNRDAIVTNSRAIVSTLLLPPPWHCLPVRAESACGSFMRTNATI
jgi:hypothetical protein